MKNVVARKYILICVVITIVFSFVMWRSVVHQNKVYEKEINSTLVNIIGLIKEEYPNISDEEIIEILNNEEFSKDGTELLEKYGVSDELVIEKMQDRQAKFIIYNIVIIILCAGSIVSVFVIYLINRKKKINYLDSYLQKVSNGKYYTELEKESEDELNRLKDSLYKITVMLKEDAESKRLQNETILNSVANISHQLKTPLTSIQILLDNIIESTDMNENTRKKFTLEILRQVKGMNFLILALLKLSRLDAGVVEFENKEINLKNLVEDIISDLDVVVDIKQISIIKNIKDVTITGDYNWNKEAILNIIKNAVEHTQEGKNVYIDIDENDVYSKITVTDEGNGIAKKDLKHIFEKFYKVTDSDSNSFGIGLALSKSIIEKQNGYISVDSKIGEGTTFIIKYLK
jgi:signal transduction histidine kinase